MYALQDYIGEENLNRALMAYVKKVACQQPPYTTSPEFLSFIRAETPDSLQYILTDLFETITLFDLKTTDVTTSKTADGKYNVHLVVEAKKLRADTLGTETDIPINDWIDIGIFAGEGKKKEDLGAKMLYLQKHKITGPKMEFDIIVDEPPTKAGIDPYHKLIDRNPEDNVKKAETQTAL